MDELPQVVGGGTVHWDAKVPRFWDIDFQQLSALGPVPGADLADWPFGYAEIAPYYDEVEKLIGVQGDVTALPDLVLKHAPRGPYPMPPGPQMRSSMAVAAGATASACTRSRSRWRPTPARTTTSTLQQLRVLRSFGCPVVARPAALIPLRQARAPGGCSWCPRRWSPRSAHRFGRDGAGRRSQLDTDDRTGPGDRHRDADSW